MRGAPNNRRSPAWVRAGPAAGILSSPCRSDFLFAAASKTTSMSGASKPAFPKIKDVGGSSYFSGVIAHYAMICSHRHWDKRASGRLSDTIGDRSNLNIWRWYIWCCGILGDREADQSTLDQLKPRSL